MPLSSEGRGRSFRQNVMLAVPLAAVAGAVNAAGFFVIGTHTSHMTGQAAIVGEALASGRPSLAWTAVQLVGVFVLGAATAAALLNLTARWRRGRYIPALALEAVVLTAAGLWAFDHGGAASLGLAAALAFAMGLQNAMVTRISGAIVRTTHLTGVLTDIGIEAVEILRRVRGRAPARDSWERLGLHVALIGSFVAGATVGGLLLLRFAEVALGFPSVVLLALVVVDWNTKLATPRA